MQSAPGIIHRSTRKVHPHYCLYLVPTIVIVAGTHDSTRTAYVPLRAEELEQVWISTEVLSHGLRHLVVVHLLVQGQREAGVIGCSFITERHVNTMM